MIGTYRTAGRRILAFGLPFVALLFWGLLAAEAAHAETFTVNSTGDSADVSRDGTCDSNFTITVTCTLRAALQEANASTTVDDTIRFGIPDDPAIFGFEVKTVTPASPLPAITDTVTIDGYTQAGARANTGTTSANNAVLRVVINGRKAGAISPVTGLAITGSGAGGTVVRGLVINGFSGNGVSAGAGDAVIEGNFVGTDSSGTLDRGNGLSGVKVSSEGNLIGGSPAASQNVISGNAGEGVSVEGSGSAGNVVSGNHIGTDADATSDLGNTRSGVHVEAPGVLVGGVSTEGAGNIISGNDRHGVEIDNIFAEGAKVRGNLIGVNGNEFSSIGNTLSGVRVSSTPRVEIGGTVNGEGNTISDNGEHGVEIVGTSSTFDRVLGNRIGTNPQGNLDFGNADAGVRLANASGAIIGGTTSGARNIIAANRADGIVIFGSLASSNRVEGNRIGTDAGGTSALGNLHGVTITGGASGNIVGGQAVGAGNLISGNTARGVLISGAATDNIVQSNRIGTDVFGTSALGNAGTGVEIFDGSNNVIGGTVSRTGNIISGNVTNGVEIGIDASDNEVAGNLIGTGQNGRVDLGNGEVGVLVRGSGNTIGVPEGLVRNVISGNGGTGVSMLGPGANGNTVQGNLIGTQVDGITPLANFHGVFISEADGNRIGGAGPATSNIISGNANHGVMVTGDSSTGNRILRNSISNNGRLGIELNNDGVTANDPRDPDAGPNRLQNFPTITSATTTEIEGRLNSRPGRTFTIRFFSNPQANFPTGFGEGEDFLGKISVRTNARGRAPFSFAVTVPAGEFVTATATDGGGNTSEFSAASGVAAP